MCSGCAFSGAQAEVVWTFFAQTRQYAYDASAGGKMDQVMRRLDALMKDAPHQWYYLEPSRKALQVWCTTESLNR